MKSVIGPAQNCLRLVSFIATLGFCANVLAVPRAEHPRPDAFRENWATLNGEWQFEIDDQDDGATRRLTSGTGSDSTLGIVDFSIFPHLDHEMLPENTLADAERWAAGLGAPAYAIDDQTAIKVVDGTVEVVSEGHWKLFTPGNTR